MKRSKSIRTFRDNIRRIFLIEAIIPVFCIAGACLICFLVSSYISVKKTNRIANQAVATTLDTTITKYSEAILELATDTNLDWEYMDIDQFVEVRRTMFHLTKGTGYSAQLYVLDKNLDFILNDVGNEAGRDACLFLQEIGIIWEINHNKTKVSLRLTNDEKRTLMIGTAIVKKGEILGYIIVSFPSAEFERLLTEVYPQTMITDQNGWIYLTNNYIFQDELGRMIRSIPSKVGNVEYKNHYYYITVNKIQNNKINVYTITDNDIRIQMNQNLSIAVVLIFIAMILITWILSGKVAKISTTDISEIASAFEHAKQGNFDHSLSIHSSIEFQEIGEAYNIMLDGLKQSIKEKKELAEHAAFAQVKQMEAQFNPHFLFNTLDNIRFMTRIDVEAADQMIVSLSNLLRYSINTSEEEITVREEISITHSYLNILKIRFNRRLTYEINVLEELEDCLIPKLLLQPLLENAVKYGFGGQDTLKVIVKGYCMQDHLIFQCMDDGAGIEESILMEMNQNLNEMVNHKNHFGIYNIHRRIRLMYGEPFGVSITSQVGHGTKLTLLLPIKLRKKEDQK